jgi:hypothetical protein
MTTGAGWSALSLVVSSVAIVILSLASGWAASEWLFMVLGLWVGFFLAWGAFRRLGWGRSAARSVYQGGIVGLVLLLVVLFVVGTMIFGVVPATPAVTTTFWTACGLVLGAVTAAGGIGRRLPEGDRSF